jgi:hypothetical protein
MVRDRGQEFEVQREERLMLSEVELIENVLGVHFTQVPTLIDSPTSWEMRMLAAKFSQRYNGPAKLVARWGLAEMINRSHGWYDPETGLIYKNKGTEYSPVVQGTEWELLRRTSYVSIHEGVHAGHHQLLKDQGIALEFFSSQKVECTEELLTQMVWAEGVAEFGAASINETIENSWAGAIRQNGGSEGDVDQMIKGNRIWLPTRLERDADSMDRYLKCLRVYEKVYRPSSKLSDKLKFRKEWANNGTGIYYPVGLTYVEKVVGNLMEKGADFYQAVRAVMLKSPNSIDEIEQVIRG